MKIFLPPLLTALAFLCGGCAAGGARSSQVFDAYHPGGPVYRSQEIVADRPMPSEPPFGTYFEESQTAPAALSDPYWIRGYWAWKKADWEWIPSRWVERPRPGLIWINPSAYNSGALTYWHTGYWE